MKIIKAFKEEITITEVITTSTPEIIIIMIIIISEIIIIKIAIMIEQEIDLNKEIWIIIIMITYQYLANAPEIKTNKITNI